MNEWGLGLAFGRISATTPPRSLESFPLCEEVASEGFPWIFENRTYRLLSNGLVFIAVI